MSGHLYAKGKMCIVMSGLPGRGKTNRSERIKRYMNWLGVKARVFHLADYRRAMLGPGFKLTLEYHLNNSPDSPREHVKTECVNDIMQFYADGGEVAIYDAINGTIAERNSIRDILSSKDIQCLFVESLVTDAAVLARNISEVGVTSPDYIGRNSKESFEHYVKYIESLMEHYEPITEEGLQCIKLVNDGEQCVVNNGPLGYLLNRVLMFLLNSRRRSGSLFFARAGAVEFQDSNFNGDLDLSPRGQMYAATLSNTVMGYVSSKQIDRMDYKMDLAKLKTVADHRSLVFASAAPSAVQSVVPSVVPSRQHSRQGSRSHSRSGSRRQSLSNEPPLLIWTSTRRRSEQTSKPLRDAGVPVISKSLLSQLNPGDAAPYIHNKAALMEHFPSEYEAYLKDQYHYRFPRGESYQDVAVRLEPIMMEIERTQTNLLVICQESVLKVLYGYIMGLTSEEIPNLEFPYDQIVEVMPHGYSNLVVHIPLAGVAPDGGVDLPRFTN